MLDICESVDGASLESYSAKARDYKPYTLTRWSTFSWKVVSMNEIWLNKNMKLYTFD